MNKSILDFSEAGREDLAAEYRDELEVLKKLLSEPVNESQIYSELLSWVESYNFELVMFDDNPIIIPKKERGNVIKHLKSKFPQTDGRIISDIVKKYVI